MTGDTHYDLEILAELAEGLLDAGTARQVRDHLAVCDPCGELLADLAAVREVLAATPTPAMPMGVALRIDKALAAEALAAEAEQRRGGVDLAEAPDWDKLMRDAPWEQPAVVSEPVRLRPAARLAPEPVHTVPSYEEPAHAAEAEETVRLGVVADDGTIVPARRVARRRRWAMPAVAAAAAAAVVGGVVVSGNLLVADGGGSGSSRQVAAQPAPAPTKEVAKARPYALTDSGHNYSDGELRQRLGGFLAPAPIVAGVTADTNKVATCVNQVAGRTKLKIFAVDQGQYNGQEAVIVVSRRDETAKRIRVDVVDPFHCKNLRKPKIGRW
ncbi:zf-HC2 domain-containing protein [Nonomuraea sp. NPDC005501]|uniref:anti-sigma factor family protein n=1 Tax=Nonomuraea sp. NPDC005501 TaxID=3156884 RepID=UPI00339EF5DF